MRPEKKIIEKEYRQRISRARVMVVTECQGLSAQAINRLRRGLDPLEAEYLVVQNRIFRRALAESNFSDLASAIQGQAAVALGGENVPELAKFLIKFIEEESSLRIRAAMWGKEQLNQEAILRLSQLPSREELLSRVIAGIQAPLSGLAGLLNQLLAGLVIVLSEIEKNKLALAR